ncbi:AAA family ATPase [Plectosphaerella cucumerina]|uniref:AAA family ATPase n=1 Tax=Plectosphaerella cucumerina TaxID=40658 RepID=A0A8K0WXY0_9PEZI|nr:AAA family ATPase [Plectosphaerella cucumerina]
MPLPGDDARKRTPVAHTISEDRTRGGQFDTAGDKWAALKPSTTPETITGNSDAEYPKIPGEDHIAVPITLRERQAGTHAPTLGRPQTLKMAHATDDSVAQSISELRRIADYLGIPEEFAQSSEEMQSYISALQAGNSVGGPKRQQKLKPLTIHRVFDHKAKPARSFLDIPHWIQGESGTREILTGSLPMTNIQAYVERHPEICFIVCRDYLTSSRSAGDSTTDSSGNVRVSHVAESIFPVEATLASAMTRFEDYEARYETPDDASSTSSYEQWGQKHEKFSSNWLEDRGAIRFEAPYLPFYHVRGEPMNIFMQALPEREKSLFQRLTDYIMSEYGDEYEAVDDSITASKISHVHLHYLYKPGVIVVQGRGSEARGYHCTSWLKPLTNLKSKPKNTNAKTVNGGDQEAELCKRFEIEAWHWDFDGHFSKKETVLHIDSIEITDRSPRNIKDLELRPLDHVDSETLQRLQVRGKWVWKCRHQQMVAYRGTGEKAHSAIGDRHMIDMQTYYEIHGNGADDDDSSWWSRSSNRLNPDVLASDDPPDDTFIYLAPPSMKGFNLKTKKWVDLAVDRFSEVEWNTGAFKSLVLHEKTKRLIQALISNQIEADMSTDIISGKGNGIIMLLHGGPGTGKTLTAESVAEIARKPLYPVTCGDIGTEPSEVEKYLESVLHLGKTWGCVVLLDEADVFLEQRSLEDLKRNALVSVFLRVLEYYDGILVLTSNRVGTFDEAFKSRIQLAIHYTSLTTHQRTKIWGNFFNRLKTLNEEGIDLLDLEDHVEDLAQHKMNGREIRNVITTARQFARWERKQQKVPTFQLNYKVMEEIIETSGKFDTYIKKLNGGMSQDELAEDEGLRLAKGT